MTKTIMARLATVEKEHQVKILFAVESGSRAWGFASPNSDWDVRFIYLHPRDWYLSIDLAMQRDVIEYPIVDEIDLNGWDIRKALQLFGQSNPSIIEWLQSPIVYCEDTNFRTQLWNLVPQIHVPEKGMHHYLHMAKNNYYGHLCAERVALKKYFYALRPLLAIRWLKRYHRPAPMVFSELLTMLDDDALRVEIAHLQRQKVAAQEKTLIAKNARLDDFIRSEIARHEPLPTVASPNNIAPLNALFQAILDIPHPQRKIT